MVLVIYVKTASISKYPYTMLVVRINYTEPHRGRGDDVAGINESEILGFQVCTGKSERMSERKKPRGAAASAGARPRGTVRRGRHPQPDRTVDEQFKKIQAKHARLTASGKPRPAISAAQAQWENLDRRCEVIPLKRNGRQTGDKK
jgi:hypothetical protein